jgi:hypothetical protein
MAIPETRTISIPIIVSQLRRRLGTKKKSTARTAPPVDGQNSLSGWLNAVAAVVLTVKVTVCADAPVTLTDVGVREQLAAAFDAVGVMAQERLTVPVNPPDGVTEIVDVLPVVAPLVTVMLPLLLRAKVPVGAAFTVTLTTDVCVFVPLTPLTVTA